jgi:serine/threonine-protein kinase
MGTSSSVIVDLTLVERALPGYALGAQVGRGGAGSVLAAKDRLRRDVAVKVLPSVPESGAHPEDEALMLTRLEHPHVVRVYDFVPAGELALIVMELLPGGDLRTRLKQSRAAPEWACAVVLAVAGALETAHRQGMLHRDVKPANVLFTADGRAKLTDFGIAKDIAGTAAATNTIIGTPRYMAPEQFEGEPLGPPVDVYALAVLAYELAAGTPLFGGSTDSYQGLREAHLNSTPPPPAGVPAQISEVLLRALAKEPARRHPSARDFALDLAQAAATVLGADWLTRAATPVDLDRDVRAAADGSPQPAPPAADRPGGLPLAASRPVDPWPAPSPSPAASPRPLPSAAPPARRPAGAFSPAPPGPITPTPAPPMPMPMPPPAMAAGRSPSPSPVPPSPAGLAATRPAYPQAAGYGTPAPNVARQPAPGGVPGHQAQPGSFGGFPARPGYGARPPAGAGYPGPPGPPGSPPDNNRRNLLIAGVAAGAVLLILIVVLVALTWPKGDDDTVVTGPSVTSPGSPPATSPAAPPPTESPTPTPSAAFSLAEQALVARLDSDEMSDCRPAADQENSDVQAAVVCISTGEKHSVAAFSFFDADAQAAYTKTRGDAVTSDGSCNDGEDHVGRWNYTDETKEQGALICGHLNASFYMYWTYDDKLTGFLTFDEHNDAKALYKWWVDFDGLD